MLSLIQPSLHFAQLNLTAPQQLRVGQTVAVADSIRQMLMGIEGDYADGEVGMTFSGHTPDGDNQASHQHAYVMPLDSTGDGFIDQVLIWSPLGFSIPNLVALECIQAEMLFGETHLELCQITHHIPAWLATQHTSWISATPALSFRHYKKSAGTMEAWWLKEMTRSCIAQGLPAPVDLKLIHPKRLPPHWRSFSFERPSRPNHRQPFSKGILMEFDTPVIGPLSVGELVHFGMGRMVPNV